MDNQNKDNHTKQIDAALLSRISKADEKALEQLYNRYYSRLQRFISRTTGTIERVDEIINEVMYVIWQKADSYDRICQPSTWIFGIAYNKARKTLIKTNFDRTKSLDSTDTDDYLVSQDDTPFKQLEMQNWLDYGLARLSADQRAVIELSYFQGMNYSEIAELMKCPENTIKTRMYHARKKLAPILLKLENSNLMPGEPNE